MLQGEKRRFTITDINNEGEGVVRSGDERFVLFVPDALPGEDVTCRIARIKKNYGIAKVTERHSDSADRITPLCPHFGSCGGCQLQHMTYEAQLKLKTRAVYDALTRIGGIALPPVGKCVASPSQWGYRNKAAVPVQNCGAEKFVAGFYRPRSHDIIHLKECKVLLPELERKLLKTIAELRRMGFVGYDEKAKSKLINFIRHIVFREGQYSKESLCALIGTKKLSALESKKITVDFHAALPELNGFIYNLNDSPGNFIWGDRFGQVYGAKEMEECLDEYRFRFEISSFFQINSGQTVQLYKKAAEQALANSPSNILELYSGVGSLTAFLAAGAGCVTAVESWQAASAYIDINAKHNGLTNVKVCPGKAEDIADDLKNSKYETVVLDPPRTGCAPKVINAILQIAPHCVVYVSCNPATLARDIKPLIQGGYILEAAQPYDMFPQTGHVETCVLLSHKNS